MTDIVTSRLRLRRFRQTDAPELARYRSDPDVARYQGWRSPIDAREAAAIVAGYRAERADEPGRFQYAVEVRGQRTLVGDIAVTRDDDCGPAEAELGITLAPGVRHRGYATEAMSAVAHHLFATGVRRIGAVCHVHNTASAAMLGRVGFRQWGRGRQYLGERVGYADLLLFAMSYEQLHRAPWMRQDPPPLAPCPGGLSPAREREA
ncbi:GNAT family N-acetyltransferase [Streptomyces sp. NPDC090025]|uniref:GNAT family N-acetyltransferase n=1 Tax=Streptomyces sp. NPDC090025 TaxID=3365922 RepID=UPI0038323B93